MTQLVSRSIKPVRIEQDLLLDCDPCALLFDALPSMRYFRFSQFRKKMEPVPNVEVSMLTYHCAHERIIQILASEIGERLLINIRTIPHSVIS